MTSTVWSCGGGTQSAAIAALIVQRELPPPDIAVMADTGREASETWRYYESTLKPALAAVGVDLHRVPHSYATVDLFSGADGRTIVMPMFTGGGQAKLPKYCSNEWKNRPVARFLRERGYKRGVIWIGFSTDEIERCRAWDDGAAWNHDYPLIDKRMTRGDCIALVERMGWGAPPRSACWMCPYRSNQEWLHLKNTDPEDFQAAVELEAQLQQVDPDVYFHRTCKPLDEVELDGQPDLFAKPCNAGGCFT